MATIGLTWQQKLDLLTRGLEWAAGRPGERICGVWKFQADAFEAPKSNDPWFELRMRRVFELGPAEVCQVDNIDSVTNQPDPTNPRKEVVVGRREFRCDMRVFGRDQEHDVVAWVIAERARTRMRLSYFIDEFLNKIPPPPADPNDPVIPSANMSIIELFDVVAMPPTEQVIMDRWQSEAVLEMRMATTVAEDDPSAVGTWIEKVEISSNILQPDGVTPLPAALQLDNRLIDASS